MSQPKLQRTVHAMRRGVCVLGLLPWLVGAQSSSAPELAVPEARAWLGRIQEAATRRNYQGVLVMMGAGEVSSSRVTHYVDGTQQYERVEALDGEARSTLRHNDLVRSIWPRMRVVVEEQHDRRVTFPALLTGPERKVLDLYEMRHLGVDRLAGHATDVLLLKARDAWRFSLRLWVERDSGLLLRADTLNAAGSVLESTAFSEVTIGGRAQPEQMAQVLRKPEGYRHLKSEHRLTQLGAEGWALQSLPAGFREISCARRTLSALEPGAVASAPANGGVLQAVFSDGVTHVSLFIEPLTPQRVGAADMQRVMGATHTLGTRVEDAWVTAVGDVPAETLRRFIVALERRH